MRRNAGFARPNLAALLASCALSACVSNRLLEPPPSEVSGLSRLWVLRTQATGFEVYATPAKEPGPTFWSGDEIEVYILEYACALDALGLERGWQSVLPPSTEGGDLGEPNQIWILKGSVSGALDWQPWIAAPTGQQRALPEALRSIRLPGSARSCAEALCRERVRLDVLAKVPLPGSRGPEHDLSFGIAIGDDRLLVGTRTGRFFEVSPEEALELTGVPTTTPSLAAFRSSDDLIWLVGRRGAVARGHPGRGGFETVCPSTSCAIPELLQPTTEVMWLDGPREGPFELFALAGAEAHALARFDGARWTFATPITGFQPTFRIASGGGVSWLGPEVAIGIGALLFGPGLDIGLEEHPNQVLRYDRGLVNEEPFPRDLDSTPSGIAHLPGVGEVVGTIRGRVLVLGGVGEWNELLDAFGRRSPLSRAIYTFVPLGPGFLYGGHLAGLAAYTPETGFCALSGTRDDEADGAGPIIGDITKIIPLGEDLFALIAPSPLEPDGDRERIIQFVSVTVN